MDDLHVMCSTPYELQFGTKNFKIINIKKGVAGNGKMLSPKPFCCSV